MTGYVPVFSTVFTGTLHGRWPDTGLWLCILAMSDRHGHVDCTPQYIASVTGLTLEDVCGCIGRFLEPDLHSRTPELQGRRLELIDPKRPWGWRIVNHARYREKARKSASDSHRVASGADAERKREQRAASRDVPPRPALSRGVPRCPAASRPQTHTQTHTQTQTESEERAPDDGDVGRNLELLKTNYPPHAARQDWIAAEHHIRRHLEAGTDWEALHAGVARYAALVAATGRHVLNPARFFGDSDRPWSQPWPLPPSKQEAREAANVAASLDWLHRKGAIDATP